MERRTLLKLGVFGSALLAVGGVGLGFWPSRRDRVPRRPLRVIGDDRFPVLAAVASRIVTSRAADPVEVAHRVDEALSRLAPEAGVEFNQLLGLLENGLAGMVLDARIGPFTRLAPAAQDAALLAYRDSRLALRRSGYQALRKLCASAFYSSDAAWADTNYPGPPEISRAIPVSPDGGVPGVAAPSPDGGAPGSAAPGSAAPAPSGGALHGAKP